MPNDFKGAGARAPTVASRLGIYFRTVVVISLIVSLGSIKFEGKSFGDYESNGGVWSPTISSNVSDSENTELATRTNRKIHIISAETEPKEPPAAIASAEQDPPSAVTVKTINTDVNKHKRPLKFFAIHIGPSKTGSSAIQRDLASNPFGVNTLGEDKDNVIYVGKRFGGDLKDANSLKEIRKIDGPFSVRPDEERQLYQEAIVCMEVLLEKYYNSSDSDRAITNKLLENDKETRASLRQAFTDKCWTHMSWESNSLRRQKRSNSNDTKLDIRYMLGSSIVESDEEYSISVDQTKKLGTRFRMFDILGYERLIVVGAYRRYADWLVSGYTESIKGSLKHNLEGLRLTIPCMSFEKFLKENINSPYGPNHTYNLMGRYKNIHVTLPMIVGTGPSKMEAKILNYFVLPKPTNESRVETFGSITTELYCNAFGKELTPHTCRQARDVEAMKTHYTTAAASRNASSLIENKGGRSNGIYHQIVTAGFRLGFLIPPDKELLAQTQTKEWCLARSNVTWCDSAKECVMIRKDFNCDKETLARRLELSKITSNGTIVIVGTNSSNISTYKALSEHHGAWTKNLPIRCPSLERLNKLLKRSLDFEELVMPKFYATPLGRKEHERLFWETWLGEMKLFCWVDIEKLFQNATSWDEIINKRMVSHDWNVSYEDTSESLSNMLVADNRLVHVVYPTNHRSKSYRQVNY